VTLAALALPVLVPILWARDGKSPADKAPRKWPGLRDVQLQIKAKDVLSKDAALGPLNIQVWVREGNAELCGPVPAPEHIDRAVQAVKKIEGIFKVSNKLYVAPPRAAEFTVPLPEPPTHSTSARPNPETGSIGRLTSHPPAREFVGPEPRPMGRDPVALLAPVVVTERRSVPAEGLAAAVERLRQTDRRFRPIQVELRGATVLVLRAGAPGEDVMAFAQAVRQVAGVESVVVRGAPR
jgi:osmotically-inducible protein OsmY